MKNRNYLAFLGLVAFVMFSFTKLEAQSMQDNSREAINQTAITLGTALKAVQSGKIYNGDLSKALNHQHYAIKLYKEGSYERAIYQSRHGRFLAMKAIRANGYRVAAGELGHDQITLTSVVPTPQELEDEVTANLSSIIAGDADLTKIENVTVK